MRFPHTDTGVGDLLAWLAVRSATGEAMEAASGIERAVAYALADREYQACIVNPRRVHDFSNATERAADRFTQSA
jgi:hypothetical protein